MKYHASAHCDEAGDFCATMRGPFVGPDDALAARHARAIRAVLLATRVWKKARASSNDEFRFADAERRLYVAQERLERIEKEVKRG